MTDKTAMTVLKNKLKFVVDELKYVNPNTEENGYKRAMENVIKDIDAQMLELEREQLLEAFVAGDERGTKEIPFNCEQYYNQTFIS